jgi:glutamyl-tRNA reductase
VRLLIEGVNHRRAPLEVRERLFVSGDGLRDWLGRLVSRQSFDGGAILSTCNRTEFYVTAPDPRAAQAELLEVVAAVDDRREWERYRYRRTGSAAVAHMFRVASGMDSAILGEAQILGQFKDALEEAKVAGSADGSLDFLMRRAISTAKRVRTETGIGRNPVGFGHAAARQARIALGDLRGRSALLVGTGKMAGSTARVLAGEGIARIYFTSRSAARADELASAMPKGVDAAAVAFSDLEQMAVNVDVIISSSSWPDYLLSHHMIARLMRRRAGRPLFLLDLAVPRDIDPQAGEVEGVHLLNIDDLGRTIDESLDERSRALPLAEAIVATEVRRTELDLARRRAAPEIRALLEEV